jgi:hypothetical protein
VSGERVNPLTRRPLPPPTGNGETYWNGERCNAARGSGVVHGTRQRVVRVFYNGEHFDLDDTDERGWRKVAFGYGSPRYGHKNVLVETGTFEPDSWAPLINEVFDRELGTTPLTRDAGGTA